MGSVNAQARGPRSKHAGGPHGTHSTQERTRIHGPHSSAPDGHQPSHAAECVCPRGLPHSQRQDFTRRPPYSGLARRQAGRSSLFCDVFAPRSRDSWYAGTWHLQARYQEHDGDGAHTQGHCNSAPAVRGRRSARHGSDTDPRHEPGKKNRQLIPPARVHGPPPDSGATAAASVRRQRSGGGLVQRAATPAQRWWRPARQSGQDSNNGAGPRRGGQARRGRTGRGEECGQAVTARWARSCSGGHRGG